jgi:thiol-disulfide isomerase/thioredoxin
MIRLVFCLTVLCMTLSVIPTLTAQDRAPWLGVILGDGAGEGANVDLVIRNSPAHRAGLEAGDRIIEINGEAVNSPAKLQMVVRTRRPGQTLALRIERAHRSQQVEVVLDAAPSGENLLKAHHVGHRAPDFEFVPTGSTSPVSIETLAGKPIIVEFWATWCTPCRPVARQLGGIARRHGDAVHVIGLSSESPDVLTRYVNTHKPSYTIAHDPEERAHKAFLVQSYPVAFLLDAQLNVVNVFTGADLGPNLEKALGTLLLSQQKQNGAPESSVRQLDRPTPSDIEGTNQ